MLSIGADFMLPLTHSRCEAKFILSLSKGPFYITKLIKNEQRMIMDSPNHCACSVVGPKRLVIFLLH